VRAGRPGTPDRLGGDPQARPPQAQGRGAGARRGGRRHARPRMIRDPRALARRCAGPLLGLAVVVGIFAAVLPHFADYRAVWRAMTHLSGREWAVIAVS